MVDTKQKINDQYRYKYANKTTFSAPGDNSRSLGIMIFYNSKFNPTFNVVVNGQLVSMRFTMNNKEFLLNIIYASDSDNPDYFTKIPQQTSEDTQ